MALQPEIGPGFLSISPSPSPSAPNCISVQCAALLIHKDASSLLPEILKNITWLVTRINPKKLPVLDDEAFPNNGGHKQPQQGAPFSASASAICGVTARDT